MRPCRASLPSSATNWASISACPSGAAQAAASRWVLRGGARDQRGKRAADALQIAAQIRVVEVAGLIEVHFETRQQRLQRRIFGLARRCRDGRPAPSKPDATAFPRPARRFRSATRRAWCGRWPDRWFPSPFPRIRGAARTARSGAAGVLRAPGAARSSCSSRGAPLSAGNIRRNSLEWSVGRLKQVRHGACAVRTLAKNCSIDLRRANADKRKSIG